MRLFSAADLDGDGYLSIGEFRQHLPAGHQMSEVVFDAVLWRADVDHDGVIDFNEWLLHHERRAHAEGRTPSGSAASRPMPSGASGDDDDGMDGDVGLHADDEAGRLGLGGRGGARASSAVRLGASDEGGEIDAWLLELDDSIDAEIGTSAAEIRTSAAEIGTSASMPGATSATGTGTGTETGEGAQQGSLPTVRVEGSEGYLQRLISLSAPSRQVDFNRTSLTPSRCHPGKWTFTGLH